MSTDNTAPVTETSDRSHRNAVSCENDELDRNNSKSCQGDDPDRKDSKRKREQSPPRENEKRCKLETGSRLKETDIGITEYIGKHAGFVATIKERYSDFHVNEIDVNGEIAKLTHQDIPLNPDDNENIEDLKKLIPSSVWDQLQVLKEKNPPDVKIDVTGLDKDERRTIHTIAKKLANVLSQTIDKDDRKFITIIQNSKKNKIGDKVRKDTRVDWKRRGGNYCHFLLHKVNMDTMDCLNQLAVHLRIRPNNFSYAGTKDRRAWTTQWMCLKKVDPCDILKASKTISGAYVGNFKYAKSTLKLGMLSGNQFRIALRNARGTNEEIKQAMVSLRDNGFINYYGLQRFGTVVTIPTHDIGKRLLQGKWDEAIQLILKPRPGEQDKELAEARQIYLETKDARAAYEKIKRVDKIEARLLKGLQIWGSKNPLAALDCIPRNIRLMYIHAYQSFVWNHVVSKRIREFGTNLIVGDLVYDKNCKENINNETTDYLSDDEFKDENDATTSTEEKNNDLGANEDIGENSKQPELNKIDNSTEGQVSCDVRTVKILTEQDLPNYTLADVVMPQPGWKVVYPPYAKAWFDEFLAEDGLTTDLRQKNRKYSLSGTYRKILEIPTNLSWKIMHYKQKYDDLILSDINEMRKRTPPCDESDGKTKALIIEMCLKPSSYATMALREVLKNDTSAETQAALSASCNMENVQSNVTTTAEIPQSDNSNLIEAQQDNTPKIHEELTDVKGKENKEDS